MTAWDFLNENIVLVEIVSGVLFLFIVILCIIVLPKVNFLWIMYGYAKKGKDPARLNKSYKKLLRKHPVVFASSVENNEEPYKRMKDCFDAEGKIVIVKTDRKNFDAIFDKFKIIVYKVLDAEFGIPCPIEDPLYKRISEYCSSQRKYCILVCKPGKLVDLSEATNEFDPAFVTTVQFYSKLRETLYILLHLAP